VDDTALLALAATQHGVVSDAQALELGYSTRTVRRRVESGMWQRPLPRVLRRVGAPDSGRQAAMAAVLWGGPDAVVSHATAGDLWALDGVTTRRIEITVPRGSAARSPLVIVHWSNKLDRVDRVRLDALPITSPTRTLIDLAAPLSAHALELAMEDAFRRRLTTPASVGKRLEVLGGPGRPGAAVLRMLLDARRGGPASASAGEIELERLLTRGGLPTPVRQHPITHGDRTIRVDFAYPDRRLAIEFDSLRWHTGRAKLDNDAERRNLLRAARWELVTVTFTMVRHRPEHTVAVVRNAWSSLAPPSGAENGQGLAGIRA
jgi:very-short-patch-repair endonuclease